MTPREAGTPERIDLKARFPELYRPGKREFERVSVPPASYLAVDGHGDPNTSPAYAAALELLYTGAYSVRAVLKRRTGAAWVVGPLEGLWTAPDPAAFVRREKDAWDWTMLLPLPAEVSVEDLDAGLAAAAAKKASLAWASLRVLALEEGESLQILHVGSYDDEAPTLARLHDELMPELGLTFNGQHHEIYLSDPRRTAPEKLRTVLRQPVRPLA
ncbi:GyrI-like domain-containing protein [Galactobacter valiniphilus]|uniref:GyrI-like domain-containing protein n=1 Tax=Galactobacter valiniphilus TaxID=2676122 RepID=UPI003735D63B